MNRENSFSRRGFVKGTAAAAGGLLLGGSGRAETPKGAPMDIDALKKACKGVVAAQGDANFTELIHGNLWNRLIPQSRAADRDPGQGRAGRHRRDSFRAGKQMEGRGPWRRSQLVPAHAAE